MGWPKGVPRKPVELQEEPTRRLSGLKDLKLIIGGSRDGFEGIEFPFTELPVDEESVSEIICDNFLQFSEDIGETMNEFHRALKQGGTITITVPLYPHKFCFTDPTTKIIFTDLSFHYFYDASPFWHDKGKGYGFKSFRALNQNVNGPYLTAVLRK